MSMSHPARRRRLVVRTVSGGLFATTVATLIVHEGSSVDRQETSSAELIESDVSEETEASWDASDKSGSAPSGSRRHGGEEGKMSHPSAPSGRGLYAMTGPKDAILHMARTMDVGPVGNQSGVVEARPAEPGHFAPSPAGAVMAVGNDDEDRWSGLTGIEVGAAFGVGGLGLVGTGRGGGGTAESMIGLTGKGAAFAGSGYGRGSGAGFGGKGKRVPRVRQRKAAVADGFVSARAHEHAERKPEPADAKRDQHWKRRMVSTAEDLKSTFSVDVDTASYSYVRSVVEDGTHPDPSSVRVEEMINYFDYDYPLPPKGTPVWIDGEVGPCPWNGAHKLVHVGVQADVIEQGEIPPRNLVFLVDVSGSMSSTNRLPLLKQALIMMVPTLRDQDRVSVVVYAGAAGEVLAPTRGSDSAAILAAIADLESGGGTNGGEGIELAYELAQRSFMDGGINRVILATDGDFNLGTTGHDALVDLISHKRETGVYLSVLRFGRGDSSDATMEQLADHGNGNYAYIDRLAEAHKVLLEQAGSTLVPVADDVKIQVEFDPGAVKSYRLVGYDNRRLAHRDFADDRKDAGDIGSGHTVTAIYEIEPHVAAAEAEGEQLMTLAVRYKHPGATDSQLLERTVYDRDVTLAETTDAFRFSAAVTELGELLVGRRFPDGGFSQVVRLAKNARGADAHCHRAGFVRLAAQSAALAGHVELGARGDLPCSPTPAAVRVRVDAPAPKPGDEMAVVSALTQAFSPLTLAATWLEFLASVLRTMPVWMCLVPAFFGGLLLSLSRRWESS